MSSNDLWVGFTTLLSKEIRRFTRIWLQTLLPPVITTTLYFLIFGNLIGPRIGEMAGFRYMDFIVPGLIIMAVITNSYANVSSSFFSARFQRFVEEMMVSPMPPWIMLIGYTSGGLARGLCVGAVVTGVSLLFSQLQIHNLAVVLSVVVLTSVLFSLAGFMNGLFARNFDDISIIPTFVLTPLTYLGGVFYSIRLLPEFWQTLSLGNPILYMINAFRFGFLGISDIPIPLSYTMIIGFIITLFVINLTLLNRGFRMRS